MKVEEPHLLVYQRQPTLALMLVVALIGISAFINVYSIQSILPSIVEDFHISPLDAGVLVGATVLAIALISPFIGLISDAFGRRNILILSIFLLSIPTALMYFAQSFSNMVLYRFLQGLVVPGIAVVTMAYIADEYRGQALTKLMSVYVSGTILGGFLGRFGTGYIAEFCGWREAFLVTGLVNLGLSIWVFYHLPPSRFFVANKHISFALSRLLKHLQNRDILLGSAIGACVLFSLVGSFTYLNFHLAAAPYNFSAAALANIFIVYLIGVVITPVSSKLIARFHFKKSIIMALCMSSTGLLLMTFSPLFWIILGITITSSGIFITQATVVSFITSRVRKGKSLATGLYNMTYYLGGFVGAWACGLTYMYGSWYLTIALLIFIQMIAMALSTQLADD